jgi:hypothetical protein
VPNHHPFILGLFTTLVLLQARVILEMLGAACTNALESFLGHLANFCERHRAGGVSVIHLSRKLFESPLDRFRRAPLGEKAGILVSIEIAFLSERLSTITPSLCHTVVLLPCVPITMVRVGK